MEHKVLIANRGEIAMRITSACEALGIPSVRVYTPGDAQSLHATIGEVYRISDYRNPNDLMEVADHAGCTAVHPGYGFFAEDYCFARRVMEERDRKLVFIGPSWKVVRDLGNKINTKKVARKLEIPTVPGSAEPIHNEDDAYDTASDLMKMQEDQRIVRPQILIKAAAGGGGMGIEQVDDMRAFRRTLRRVRNYAKQTFGDDGVLIEQCIRDFSHIEVQILGDRYGKIVHFGTRNCSIQSPGRQKRIEMAPGFDADARLGFKSQEVLEKVTQDSLQLAKEVGYDSAGTWEWIVTRKGEPYLMEVNTRLQVENDVSAKTTLLRGSRGLNLVKEQIRLGLGEKLDYTQRDLASEGCSLEFRIIAEDTEAGFIPCSGTIQRFAYPAHDWLSVYTHVPTDKPYKIPTNYDPNLALLVVLGSTVQQATQRGQQVLDALVFKGVDQNGALLKTNIEWLKKNLGRVGR